MERLDGKAVVITGGAGLLGQQHAAAVYEAGGYPVLVDIRSMSQLIQDEHMLVSGMLIQADVTDPATAPYVLSQVKNVYGEVYGLVNNAAHNPKVEDGLSGTFAEMTLERWWADLNVGLTGAFLMSQTFAQHVEVIVNVASVLSIVAPDQRLYDGAEKPVTYTVEKHGLIGLTRHIATTCPWLRCNAISPAGVENGQPQAFIDRLAEKIPHGRMAQPGEYKDAIVFLLTQTYMTGHNLVIDGGLSVW